MSYNPSSGGGTADCTVNAQSLSGQTVNQTGITVKYDTINYDTTAGAYDSSTGIFTAAIQGTYWYSASLISAEGGNFQSFSTGNRFVFLSSVNYGIDYSYGNGFTTADTFYLYQAKIDGTTGLMMPGDQLFFYAQVDKHPNAGATFKVGSQSCMSIGLISAV